MDSKKNNKKLVIIIAIAVVVIVAIVGVVVFMSSKGGNGAEEKNNNAIEETKKEDKLTIEDVAGTYKNVGLLSNEDMTYVLNSNGTVDQTSKRRMLSFKGTVSITDNGSIYLKGNNTSKSETYIKYKDYFYENTPNATLTKFSKDEEYGLKLTLNENNRTNQVFETFAYAVSSDYNTQCVYTITFSEDGTFKLLKYDRVITSFSTSNREEFEGTYNIENDIMKLNYNGKEDTLLIINDVIYFDVIQKQ